jgi:hypothetical protein
MHQVLGLREAIFQGGNSLVLKIHVFTAITYYIYYLHSNAAAYCCNNNNVYYNDPVRGYNIHIAIGLFFTAVLKKKPK